MWNYEKRLQYPVNISQPNPKMAQFIMSQYGGPDGEMGASMRYLSQRYSMPYDIGKAVLTDIGSEVAKCSSLLPFFQRDFTVALLTYNTTCAEANSGKSRYAPCCGQQSSPQCSGKRYRPAFLPRPKHGS